MTTAPRSWTNPRLFQFSLPGSEQRSSGMLAAALRLAERVTGVQEINSIYARAAECTEPESFHDRLLHVLNVSLRVDDGELSRIPQNGPVVVVSNHPFGGVEGIALAQLMERVRPDCKLIANYLLNRVPEFHENMLYVDPFGGAGAAAGNLGSMRKAIRWLTQGGALAVFPAGEVAHLTWGRREVLEGAWSANVARLIAISKAPVVPVFFDGQNGSLFQTLGLVHPVLRTAMLAHEVINKQGRALQVRIGTPVPWRRLSGLGSPDKIAKYLRQRTLMLRYRTEGTAPAAAPRNGVETPIATPGPVDEIADEVENLPAECLLVESEEFRVYCQRGERIPNLLRELGRLRETTYRDAGEGTGSALDNDRFDEWYDQMFVWNVGAREIVGAYRLGRCDEILSAHGIKGLYTSTLFNFRDALLARLGPALELGRSFVRKEYQRSYAPLMLLWRGIGSFVTREPRYRSLFGPVSISNQYQSISRQLMVEFLERRHSATDLSSLARPRRPFRSAALRGSDRSALDGLLRCSDDLGDLVAELEPDRNGIPVLLRQYLKLGAKFFAFNVDADFNDAVDALMYVDLAQTERRTLHRYLTPAGAEAFLSYHGTTRLPLMI